MPRKYLHHLNHAPELLESLRAARQSGKTLTLTLETFEDDPFSLYAALWLAWSEGTEVRFLAPAQRITHPIS